MSDKLPKVKRTNSRQTTLMYVLVATAALLIIAVAVLLATGGIFSDEPRTDAERDYQVLLEGLKRDPQNPAVLMTLAEAEYEMGKEADALKHAEAAVRFAKKQPGFGTRYANLLVMSGEVDQARKALKAEIALKTSGDAEPFFLMAQIERETGNLDEAEKNIKRAIEIVPTSADFLEVYGSILEKQGNEEKAIQAYRGVLRFIPDHTGAIAALKRLGVEPPASTETTAHGGTSTP